MAYDSGILERFAEDMYRRAARIERWTMLRWGLLGAALSGGLTGAAVHQETDALISVAVAAVAGGLLLGLIGRIVGRVRAFRLRLEAQRTLVLVAIERNTRGNA